MELRCDAERPTACARLTGAFYLVIIIGGLFAELGVRQRLIVPGDVAATAANLAAREGLFRLGLAGDLAAFLADVAVAALLYVLLRPAGRTLAAAAAAFRLTGTAIYAGNLLHMLGALQAVGGSASPAAFEPAQRRELMQFHLDLHAQGYDLGLVFFGVHCLLLGWLLWRSVRFPGVLGVLMAVAGAVYLAGSFTLFLAPSRSGAVEPAYFAAFAGELAFCGWLLVRGVRRA